MNCCEIILVSLIVIQIILLVVLLCNQNCFDRMKSKDSLTTPRRIVFGGVPIPAQSIIDTPGMEDLYELKTGDDLKRAVRLPDEPDYIADGSELNNPKVLRAFEHMSSNSKKLSTAGSSGSLAPLRSIDDGVKDNMDDIGSSLLDNEDESMTNGEYDIDFKMDTGLENMSDDTDGNKYEHDRLPKSKNFSNRLAQEINDKNIIKNYENKEDLVSEFDKTQDRILSHKTEREKYFNKADGDLYKNTVKWNDGQDISKYRERLQLNRVEHMDPYPELDDEMRPIVFKEIIQSDYAAGDQEDPTIDNVAIEFILEEPRSNLRY